jgi:hypothetical protein
MATRSELRLQEAGVSLIEALLTVALTALIAVLVLGLGSRVTERGFSVSYRTLDAVESDLAEREVRALLRAIVSPLPGETEPALRGERDTLLVRAGLAAPVACAADGVHVVQLRIERGGLWCESDGRRSAMLRWNAGSAQFSYSEDAKLWATTWREPSRQISAIPVARTAPMARFEFRTDDGRGLSWTFRVGSTEPGGSRLAADVSP